MPIEIRRAVEADIPELGRLVQGIAAYHESLDERIRYDWKQLRDTQWLRTVLNRDHHAIWVADFGNRALVGYLWVYLRRHHDARIPAVWGYINQAFLEENWRGKRLMRPMLHEAFQWFLAKGITHIHLVVHHHNWIGSAAWYRFKFQDYFHEQLLVLKASSEPPL